MSRLGVIVSRPNIFGNPEQPRLCIGHITLHPLEQDRILVEADDSHTCT